MRGAGSTRGLGYWPCSSWEPLAALLPHSSLPARPAWDGCALGAQMPGPGRWWWPLDATMGKMLLDPLLQHPATQR